MADKEMLLSYIGDLDKLFAQLDEAREEAKGNYSNAVKELFDNFGKGPHKVNDEACTVVIRGDYYFLKALRGTKGLNYEEALKAKEAKAEKKLVDFTTKKKNKKQAASSEVDEEEPVLKEAEND